MIFIASLSGCINDSFNSNTWIVNQSGGADFTDIQSAVDAASDGDIILLVSGEYQSTVNISKSITISSDGDARFIGDGSDNAFITIKSDNVVVRGLVFENGLRGIVVLGNNCTIDSNVLRNNSVGIELSKGTKDNVVVNNFFDNKMNIAGSGTAELNGIKQTGENIIGGGFVGGNYWGDYQGFDVNDDGIGDTLIPYKGGLNWLNGGDWLPLTNRSLQAEVFVDDEYTPNTSGWDISHFSSIEKAVAAAEDNGMIYIARGEYSGPIVLNKTLMLIGEDQQETIIRSGEGLSYGMPIIHILKPNCYLANFSVMASSNIAGRIGIDGESENTTIVNVTVQGFEYGVRFLFVHGSNTVLSSDIINCNNGIYSSYTRDNVIKNNNIENCSQYGIFLNAGSDNNLVENNDFRDNEYAMRVKGSTLNLLKHNSFKDNSKGIYFCCGARNNTVTRNSFYESGDWHASDQYRNIWDLDGVGNYWDDYAGEDADGDGIGDIAYIITEGYSTDRFPIVDESFLEK